MLDGIRSNAQSFVVKLAFGLIIVVFVFWGIGAYTGSSQLVAEVNGKNITMVEFQRSYQVMENNLRNTYPDLSLEMIRGMNLEYQVLQALVEQKMFELESERTGIDVSAYDLRRYVESTGAFNGPDGKFSPDLYMSSIKQYNQTASQFEDSMRRDLLPAKFQALVGAGAWGDPEMARNFFNYQNETRSIAYLFFPAEKHIALAAPNEEEIAEAYAGRSAMYTVPARVRLEYVNLDPARLGDPSSISDEAVALAYQSRQSQFSTPEQVKARHILILVGENAPEDQVKQAEDTILSLEKRIRNGEDFSEVAREAGQDDTASSGGDLGWFTHAQMVPAFADAAFALEPGQMSGPVRSRFGFHLIRVDDKKAAETRGLEEVREELRTTLAAQAARDGLQVRIDDVRAAVLGGKSMSEAAALVGLQAESSGLIGADGLGVLGIKAADVDAVMNTPAGQPLSSALYTDSGALVIKVTESLPQSVRPLEEVRDDLVFWLTREKAREMAREEAGKVRQTFAGDSPQGELPGEIKISEMFGRSDYIPELGLSAELIKDVFILPVGDAGKNMWLENAYSVDEGAVLAALAEVRLPADEQWQAEGDGLERVLQQEKANMMFYAYRTELFKNLQVKILNEALFATQ